MIGEGDEALRADITSSTPDATLAQPAQKALFYGLFEAPLLGLSLA
jgi:hypothetical protein